MRTKIWLIAAVVLPWFAGANLFALLFAVGLSVVLGGWIGSYLVVRSLAD